MKLKSKAYLRFRIKLQQFGIFFVLIGIAMTINHLPFSRTIIFMGSVWFGIAKIMQAFEPVYKSPQWEKVFPELDENYESTNHFEHETDQ